MTYNVAMSTHHDASLAIVKDGELQFLFESERYTHIKHSKMHIECLDEVDKYNNNYVKGVTSTGLAVLEKTQLIIYIMHFKHFTILDSRKQYV